MRWPKVVGFAVCIFASRSYAQPAPDDGSYPLEYAARPLALPTGAFEGTAQLDWLHGRDTYDYDAEYLNLDGRYSLGQAELDIGANFLLDQSDIALFPGGPAPEIEHFASITAGGRFNLDPNLQLGGELLVGTPTRSEARALVPRVTLATRHHLAPHTAVEILGTAAYHTTISDSDSLTFVDQLELGAEVRAIAQLSPNVAAQAKARLAFYDPKDDPEGLMLESYFIQYFAMGVVVATSRALDITAHVGIPGQQTVELMVGVNGRFLP